MFTLLTGGARSGKSVAAVELARADGAPVVFVATAEAGDAEMGARIRNHRQARPAEWTTIEAPRDLLGAIATIDATHTVIIDCLALWVTNRLGDTDVEVLDDAHAVATTVAARRGASIVVTNEVGSGIVPANALARRFRDLLGSVNQEFARASDRAFLCASGGVLPLQPLTLLHVAHD